MENIVQIVISLVALAFQSVIGIAVLVFCLVPIGFLILFLIVLGIRKLLKAPQAKKLRTAQWLCGCGSPLIFLCCIIATIGGCSGLVGGGFTVTPKGGTPTNWGPGFSVIAFGIAVVLGTIAVALFISYKDVRKKRKAPDVTLDEDGLNELGEDDLTDAEIAAIVDSLTRVRNIGSVRARRLIVEKDVRSLEDLLDIDYDELVEMFGGRVPPNELRTDASQLLE